MPRRRLAQLALCFATLGLLLFSAYWTCRFVTAELDRAAGWFFPGGVIDIRAGLAWGPLYVFLTILLYMCALLAPWMLMMAVFERIWIWMGWPLPPRLPRDGGYY